VRYGVFDRPIAKHIHIWCGICQGFFLALWGNRSPSSKRLHRKSAVNKVVPRCFTCQNNSSPSAGASANPWELSERDGQRGESWPIPIPESAPDSSNLAHSTFFGRIPVHPTSGKLFRRPARSEACAPSTLITEYNILTLPYRRCQTRIPSTCSKVREAK
jgi:hypothetical protein